MSAEKNILLLLAYTSCMKHVKFYLPLPISVTVSVSTVSVFIFFTLTPDIPILFTLSHNISSSVQTAALDIQHFLKPSTVTSSEITAIMIHTD